MFSIEISRAKSYSSLMPGMHTISRRACFTAATHRRFGKFLERQREFYYAAFIDAWRKRGKTLTCHDQCRSLTVVGSKVGGHD